MEISDQVKKRKAGMTAWFGGRQYLGKEEVSI